MEWPAVLVRNFQDEKHQSLENCRGGRRDTLPSRFPAVLYARDRFIVLVMWPSPTLMFEECPPTKPFMCRGR